MAHVLVVDDDATIRALVAEALDLEGHSAEGAATGEEALGKVRGRKPDLVLLDLAMPDMDGAEFVQACRADPEYADVPIVLMTAACDVERRSDELKAQGALAKPFTLDQLDRAVADALA
jgi:CheY-like chemotaxis protein